MDIFQKVILNFDILSFTKLNNRFLLFFLRLENKNKYEGLENKINMKNPH